MTSTAKSRQERVKRYARYHPYYNCPANTPREICTYCHQPSGCMDHMPPLEWVDNFGLSWARLGKIEFWLIPSCLECNSLLGAHPSLNFHDRLGQLKERFFKKHALDINVRTWDTHELRELGYALRKFVLAAVKRRDTIRDRYRTMCILYDTFFDVQPLDHDTDSKRTKYTIGDKGVLVKVNC